MSRPDDRSTTRRDDPRPSSSGLERASLVFYGRDGAKVAALAAGGSIVVGRAWPADVVIADPSLSRKHARFSWDEQGWEVEDLGSTNGTRVNGKVVERARFGPNDEVIVGGIIASLHVLAPKEEQLRGIDGHDRFLGLLEDEVVRSRTFGRPLALVMIRAIDQKARHVSRWAATVRRNLRPVDHVGLYGPDTLLVLLPEADHAHALNGARAIVADRADGAPDRVAGIAVFPQDGGSAEELISVARDHARSATAQKPIVREAPLAADEPPAGRGPTAAGTVIAKSVLMREVFQTVERVGRSHIPVLLVGETGAGKEIVARAIHESGPRKGKPLRSINCGAIPATLIESILFGHEKGAFTGADRAQKGIFEQADGGTVLLDEVGELPAAAQAALLRVLESKRVSRLGSDREVEVDVRVVAATHRNLEAMCEAGAFRTDLLYRLNAMTIQVPPLRERQADIAPLAEMFLAEANRENETAVRRIDSAALALLERHAWPGNVREMRNVIERAVVIAESEAIRVEDLPDRIRGEPNDLRSAPPAGADSDSSVAGDHKERMRRFEIDLIVDALGRSAGNQTEAARLLRMPLRTLVHKMHVHGISKSYGVVTDPGAPKRPKSK